MAGSKKFSNKQVTPLPITNITKLRANYSYFTPMTEVSPLVTGIPYPPWIDCLWQYQT